jgi:putative transcriptional regulator
MNINPGSILISNISLTDPNFEKVVIVIAEHNEKGALGFVINKTFQRSFNELSEFKDSVAFPLFEGGPVEKENLYFIHRRADLITGGQLVFGSVYFGGNFQHAVHYMNNKSLLENDIKLFIGYCGWNDNELEEEVVEGSWLMANASLQEIFTANTALLWEHLYAKVK